MFLAQTKNNFVWSAEECTDRTVNEPFYCPACKSRVFLKKGSIIRPHFAHSKDAACQSFSEGETPFHLDGKAQLCEWLSNQQIPFQLEAWLPTLQQRPDVLVDGTIPIEYQCSVIPGSLIKNRTEGYNSLQMEPLWIGGMGYEIKGVLADRHRKLMSYSNESGYHFVVFDTEKSSFLFYEQIHYADQNQLRYVLTKKELQHTTLADLLHPRNQRLAKRTSCQTISFKKRMNLLHMKDSNHQQFLERLYLNRHALQLLPDFLFTYPTKSVSILEPSYGWKYKLLLSFLEQSKARDLQTFTRQLKRAELPLCELDDAEQTVQQFVDELLARKWLRKSASGSWVVNFSPSFHIENY